MEPEEFVAERKRLERCSATKAERRRRTSWRSCASRRSPSYAANRLARDRPDDIAKLVSTGERLAAAHGAETRQELREAQAELTDLVTTLAGHAGKLSDAIEQRLAVLLRAAASSPATAALLRRGVLSDEVEPAAFDALAGMTLRCAEAAPDAGATSPSRRASATKATSKSSKASSQRLTAAVRQAERELRKAETDHERAARRVAQLEKRLEDARAGVEHRPQAATHPRD